jgi:dTDP-4-amino-4,6-dideoxygalactose transaminase
VVTVDEERTGLDRDAFVTVLEAENVLARRYFHPACHRMEPNRSLQPKAGLVLPVTEELTGCVMTLPTGQTVTPEIIEGISEILTVACENADEIRAELAGRSYEPKPARS